MAGREEPWQTDGLVAHPNKTPQSGRFVFPQSGEPHRIRSVFSFASTWIKVALADAAAIPGPECSGNRHCRLDAQDSAH